MAARDMILILLVLSLFALPGVLAQSPLSGDEELLEITSDNAFAEYLKNQTAWYQTLYARTAGQETMEYAALPASSPAPMTMAKDSAAGAADYSTTNVQVQGVDEVDYLKNDGKYLYVLSDQDLLIADVFPPEQGKIVSRTPVPGNPSGLFLLNDTLVIFSSEYEETWSIYGESEVPVPTSTDVTHAIIYDVENHAAPQKIRELILPGSYENGRMIGSQVYAITRENRYSPYPLMPVVLENDLPVAKPSVWCPPIPMNQFQLYTLTSFDLAGTPEVHATSFLMGWDNTLYVSMENAYLAYKKWNPYWWDWSWRSSDISPNNEGEESVIHRFSLNNGSVTYQATGTVPGHLLNQFSLDEYEENLRVATTNEQYQKDEWIQDNNVYVLSPSLDIIGNLQHLAPGEKIYAARFMGDLLYLVTFKQTDPLFVIDLSVPEKPGILGELKIPGYSDYLHPYDKTHLIGIGKDTEENEWGGVIPTGVKVAFFNVADLNNPRLVDSRIIGEKGSSSEVLNDHKAFLFDQKRSTMILPINEIIRIPIPESRYKDSYTTASWKGAYVLGIDPETGFIDKGKIEQEPVSPQDYYSSSSQVRRTVIMDDIVYTISDTRIVGSRIDEPDTRVLSIDLTDASKKS